MKSLMYCQSPFLSFNPFYEFSLMDVVMPKFGFLNEGLHETENSYFIENNLDGFSKKDLSLNVSDNKLIIEGKHNSKGLFNKTGRTERHIRKEIMLPVNANLDSLKATFKNGVLHIEIPKKTQARKIHVSGSDKEQVDLNVKEPAPSTWMKKVKEGWQSLFSKAA